jgi:hypothetical protein
MEREVMSPQGIGITTYKTRVATSKPCKAAGVGFDTGRWPYRSSIGHESNR